MLFTLARWRFPPISVRTDARNIAVCSEDADGRRAEKMRFDAAGCEAAANNHLRETSGTQRTIHDQPELPRYGDLRTAAPAHLLRK